MNRENIKRATEITDKLNWLEARLIGLRNSETGDTNNGKIKTPATIIEFRTDSLWSASNTLNDMPNNGISVKVTPEDAILWEMLKVYRVYIESQIKIEIADLKKELEKL